MNAILQLNAIFVSTFFVSFPSATGIWFFHCHIETHLAQGKAIVLQVGDRSEFPPVPDGFPRCGSFGIKNTDKRGNSDQDRRTCSNSSVRAALSFWGAFVLICAQSAFELI